MFSFPLFLLLLFFYLKCRWSRLWFGSLAYGCPRERFPGIQFDVKPFLFFFFQKKKKNSEYGLFFCLWCHFHEWSFFTTCRTPDLIWHFEGVSYVNLLFLGTHVHLEKGGFIMFIQVIYECFLAIQVFGESDVTHSYRSTSRKKSEIRIMFFHDALCLQT